MAEEVKSGYVHKCGKGVKSWKRRWFVLKTNGYLYYYEHSNCKNEKGKVDLVDSQETIPYNDALHKEKLPPNLPQENAFAIVTHDRTYNCCCEIAGEHEGWIKALNKARLGASADLSDDRQYPAPTYHKDDSERAEQISAPTFEAPPPYAKSAPPTAPAVAMAAAASAPSKPPSAPRPMPTPEQYGGTAPYAPQPAVAPYPAPPRPPTAQGYQQGYPVGAPPPQRQSFSQPGYAPRPAYNYPPPAPRPQYSYGPQYAARPPPQPYAARPPPAPYRPSAGYYPPQRPVYRAPPQPVYRAPPPRQQQTTVQIITIPAPQPKVIVRRRY